MNRPRRTALIAFLIALSVFGIAGGDSDAQEQTVTCPDGTVLSADGTSCLSEGVNDNVTTTTSCVQGVLSDDGTTCIVPRIDTPAPAPAAGGDTPIEAPIPTFTG